MSTLRRGEKNTKTLHTTSPRPDHLLIAPCRLTVRHLELTGTFKLLLPKRLRMQSSSSHCRGNYDAQQSPNAVVWRFTTRRPSATMRLIIP